jgi:hypothetical protein
MGGQNSEWSAQHGGLLMNVGPTAGTSSGTSMGYSMPQSAYDITKRLQALLPEAEKAIESIYGRTQAPEGYPDSISLDREKSKRTGLVQQMLMVKSLVLLVRHGL